MIKSKIKKSTRKVSLSKKIKRPSFIDQHFWLISAVSLLITFFCLVVIRNVEIKKNALWKMNNQSSKIYVPNTSGEDDPVVIDLTEDSNDISP